MSVTALLDLSKYKIAAIGNFVDIATMLSMAVKCVFVHLKDVCAGSVAGHGWFSCIMMGPRWGRRLYQARIMAWTCYRRRTLRSKLLGAAASCPATTCVFTRRSSCVLKTRISYVLGIRIPACLYYTSVHIFFNSLDGRPLLPTAKQHRVPW
jgi:hypothetical protein